MSVLRNARLIRSPLMAFFAMGIFWGVWGALIPDIKKLVGADDRALGFALLFVALGSVPAMVLGGRVVDRIGYPLLPASVLIFAGAVILPGLTGSPAQLSAALLILGMGSGLMDVMMNARIGAIEAATGTRSMHLAHGLFAVVYLGAAFATGAARNANIAPLGILLTASATMAILAFLSGMLGCLDRVSKPQSSHEQKTGRQFSLPVILLGLITFAAFLAENGWQSWSALFIERTFGAEPWLGSAGPATVGVALAAGRLGGQAIAERISDMAMLVGATLVSVLGGILVSLSMSPIMAVAGIFIAAAGVSVMAPSALSLAGRITTPERRGAAVAAVGVIGYTGFFAGPAMLGFISDAFGLRLALAAIVVVLLLVFPVLALFRGITHQKTSEATHE